MPVKFLRGLKLYQPFSKSDLRVLFKKFDNLRIDTISNNFLGRKEEYFIVTGYKNISKKDIILETYTYFHENYKNFFKYKGKRRPFLEKEKFLTNLTESNVIECQKIRKSEELIDMILELNSKYSLNNLNF